jgi:hypothetical protein
LGTDAQEKRGLTRGQGAALIVLIVAIAGVYVLIALALRGRGAASSGPVQPAGPAPVALSEAQARAREWAAGWQADAQLVGVTGGWQLDGVDGARLYPSAWTFSYYSAGAGSVQIVTVEQDGTSALRQMPVPQRPVPVEADWGFVSEDMLLTFMAHGGQGFLDDHPQASLRAQLSGREGGRSIWYLSAIDPAAGASLQVQIDALSREVLAD